MKVLTKVIKRMKAKGFIDTSSLLWNMGTGIMDYYLNPFAKKTTRLPKPDYERIRDNLETFGINVITYEVDTYEFYNWLKEADFPNKYVNSYGKVFIEKALEYYVAAKLLELTQDDVLIDVGAAGSPWHEISTRMYGCTTYALDLAFPHGINGKKIGADATAMPLPDGFATKLALHCAYEMFEGDADIRLLPEARRALKSEGKMVILPLYMHNLYFADSSPLSDRRKLDYQGAKRVWRNDGHRVRFSRKYSVNAFLDRVVRNLSSLKLKIHFIKNEKEVSQVCYLKFAALFEK